MKTFMIILTLISLGHSMQIDPYDQKNSQRAYKQQGQGQMSDEQYQAKKKIRKEKPNYIEWEQKQPLQKKDPWYKRFFGPIVNFCYPNRKR